jgi:hypothetical protein
MRKTVIVVMGLICAAALALYAGDEPSLDRAAIEKAVLAANAEMVAAGDSLDVERFFSYILDSGKGPIIQSGQLFETREEAFDTVRRGYAALSGIERTYRKTFVTVISAEAAVLAAQGTVTVTFSDGGTFTSPFAVSMVFVLREGQWKVLHGHYSVPTSM